MKRTELRVASEAGVEATITSEGQHGGKEDDNAVVSIHGIVDDKKVYGLIPFNLSLWV